MAEKLKTHSFKSQGGPKKYDWDNWTDGNPWRLSRGVDFETVSKVTTAARAYALRLGFSCHIDVESEDTVVIQFRAK